MHKMMLKEKELYISFNLSYENLFVYEQKKKKIQQYFFVDYVIMGDFENEHSLRTIEWTDINCPVQ